MELWKSMVKGNAKREFVDGKLMYTTTTADGRELKISHSDLEKRFIPKQYGVQTNALKLSSSFINTGKQGIGYDFNGALNAYERLMTNKQEVLGLINSPFGSMEYSFTDALKGKDSKLVGELLGALNNIGGFNVEGDERPDQITMSNLNKLVSTLTDPDDENFNLATTKRVAAAFYADNDGRMQHQKGKRLYDLTQQRRQEQSQQATKTDKFGGFSQYSDTGGDPDADVNSFQSIPYSDKVTRRKSLLNLETVPGAHYTYKYDGNNEGGWQAFDGTKFVRNMDGADVARIEGLMSANDSSFSDFNVGKVKSDLDEKELQPKKPGTVGLGSINIEGNTTKDQVRRVANNLEEVFDENFKNEFDISVVSQNRIGGGGMFGGSSRTTTTPNKIRIKSKDGSFDKIYDIGPNATQKTVDQINIDFADYIAIDSSYED